MKSSSRKWPSGGRSFILLLVKQCSAVRSVATARSPSRQRLEASNRNRRGRFSMPRLSSGERSGWGLGLTMAAVLAVLPAASAQVSLPTGQNIAPSYEGWEENPDGSYALVFGYFNRNWEEEIDLPIGPDNNIQPGAIDQGQPTHFYPRRNRFVFRIRVPGDFGKQEVVWTLTSHGKTERAYATLKPDYFIDDIVIQNNTGAGGPGGGAPGTLGNKAP